MHFLFFSLLSLSTDSCDTHVDCTHARAWFFFFRANHVLSSRPSLFFSLFFLLRRLFRRERRLRPRNKIGPAHKRRLWANWKHPSDSANYRNIMSALSPVPLPPFVLPHSSRDVAVSQAPRSIPSPFYQLGATRPPSAWNVISIRGFSSSVFVHQEKCSLTPKHSGPSCNLAFNAIFHYLWYYFTNVVRARVSIFLLWI